MARKTEQAARTELRRLREEGGRESERIVELWRACLSDLSYKLGDEVWIVYEQVFLASLDTGDEDVACDCMDALKAQFPRTIRVQRLQGMLLEYKGEFDIAKELYDAIVNSDPTNTMIRKRLVAILKAQGKNVEAIKELNKYLEIYMSDYDAWQELCDLYLKECDYKKAAFCMEELLLSNPHSHLFSQKYAEIKYTEGGTENMEIARSYFANACKLYPNNVRALFGLFLSSSNLSQSTKSHQKTKKESSKTSVWAANRITQMYKQVEDGDFNVEDQMSMLTLDNCSESSSPKLS